MSDTTRAMLSQCTAENDRLRSEVKRQDATLTRLRDLLGVASDDEIVPAVAKLQSDLAFAQGKTEGIERAAEAAAKEKR